jgi:ElaB/YqjD/DUF883 family membrane-anchored ribosome-binding protein
MNAHDEPAPYGSASAARLEANAEGSIPASPGDPEAERGSRVNWRQSADRDFRGRGLTLGDFRAEVSSILDDVGYLLRNESVVNPELKAQLEQRFERLRGTVSLLAEDARMTGERMRAQVSDRVQTGLTVSRDAVTERPITAVAAAAAIGLSLGLLLANRR